MKKKETTSKLKIGIDARFFSTSAAGLGRYNHELLRHLLAMDKENEYYILLRATEYKGFPFRQKNVHPVLAEIAPYSWAEQTRLATLIGSLGLDLIHFTNFNTPLRGLKVPSVVTIHDLTLAFFAGRKRKNPWYRLAYKLNVKTSVWRARRVIAISQHTKKDLVRYFGADPKKISVIYEGVTDDFRPSHSGAAQNLVIKKYGVVTPFIMYVGQWRRHKNLVLLLEAFKVFKEKSGLSHKLILVGKVDPAFGEIPRKIKELALGNQVVLTGYVRDEDLPLFYAAADLFVFPSLYEGFGLPPLEAMASGTPVLAARASVLPEVLGRAAEFFNPLDEKDLAERMTGILKNANKRKNLSAAGLKHIKKFDWHKTAKETLAVYKLAIRNQ